MARYDSHHAQPTGLTLTEETFSLGLFKWALRHYSEALEAIEHLTAHGYFVFAWEGWIKYPDGRHGHSAQHQGTIEFWGTQGQSVEERLKEAALFARQTIEKSHREWNDRPEVAGATLYFCLSTEAA